MTEHSARNHYLETEVLTATPQKLHLMLIDGALRSAEQARRAWEEGDGERACEALIRAQQIVGEMLGDLSGESAPELAKQVAAIYLFIFRSLLEASSGRDQEKLDEAVRVLKLERETWQEVCEKLGSRRPEPSSTGIHHEEHEGHEGMKSSSCSSHLSRGAFSAEA